MFLKKLFWCELESKSVFKTRVVLGRTTISHHWGMWPETTSRYSFGFWGIESHRPVFTHHWSVRTKKKRRDQILGICLIQMSVHIVLRHTLPYHFLFHHNHCNPYPITPAIYSVNICTKINLRISMDKNSEAILIWEPPFLSDS